MKNPVLDSTLVLIQNPNYVFIDHNCIASVAKNFAEEEFKIPAWDAPVFLEGDEHEVVDFFFLGNSINFAFTDFDSGEKWAVNYSGTEWRGAFGMWASLKRSIEEGYPLLEGVHLASISDEDLKHIFRGNIEIPMLNERGKIFREVGKVLSSKYMGHFYNLFKLNDKLFDNGTGLVERLTTDFPSFNDSVYHEGKIIRFDKRAQLALAMTYGRLLNKGEFKMEGVDELTVFADYILPKSLRDLGILVYDNSLAEAIDNQRLIPINSKQELEIRASTIHASQMLQDKINEYRKNSPINALHLDYRLWSESRKTKGYHHLTKTINY